MKRYHAEELKNRNDSSNESNISTTPEAEAKKIKKQKTITSYISKKSLLYDETDAKKLGQTSSIHDCKGFAAIFDCERQRISSSSSYIESEIQIAE